MTFNRHQLDEALGRTLESCSVHALDDFGQMDRLGGFLCAAKLATEVPKVNADGQRYPALSFDVLAYLVFDGVQHAVGVFAFNLKFERFSHRNL